MPGVAQGRPGARARDLLRLALKRQPDDPALYRMLAQAAGDSGARVEAHQAQAKAQYLNGNPDAAIEQLQIAARLARAMISIFNPASRRASAPSARKLRSTAGANKEEPDQPSILKSANKPRTLHSGLAICAVFGILRVRIHKSGIAGVHLINRDAHPDK